MSKGRLIKGLMTSLTMMVASSVLASNDYPSKPIKVVVPYAAGASTDGLARLVGNEVSEILGQPVIAENRAGAGGTIASDYVRRQDPDGYTFMLTTDGIMSVNPAIYKSLAYDSLKDFSPLSVAVSVPLVLVVNTNSPFQTMEELLDFARNNPTKLSYGSAGVGSSQHMAGELMKEMAEVDIQHIPYRGGAPAMTDLLGGHIDMMLVQTASAKALAADNKIRILGIGSPERSAILPDVRTFQEIGLDGYDSNTWYGFNMPGGADPAVQQKLSEAIVQGLNNNRPKLEALGYTIVASTPDEMRKSIETNLQKWATTAKKAGIYQSQ
ncbi:Bug family tripartite tricarboxylate transporter substrate binding protein [Orrella marina]|uniref:Bug family tripartite tricarboxylate transporter substrate binding protein n=1 Tax=Orrella marina TaxID=2163011 RepID=UPI00131F0AB8|nr:tripartite tricarboxylate transporter substrate binding protein [Orrella marina]